MAIDWTDRSHLLWSGDVTIQGTTSTLTNIDVSDYEGIVLVGKYVGNASLTRCIPSCDGEYYPCFWPNDYNLASTYQCKIVNGILTISCPFGTANPMRIGSNYSEILEVYGVGNGNGAVYDWTDRSHTLWSGDQVIQGTSSIITNVDVSNYIGVIIASRYNGSWNPIIYSCISAYDGKYYPCNWSGDYAYALSYECDITNGILTLSCPFGASSPYRIGSNYGEVLGIYGIPKCEVTTSVSPLGTGSVTGSGFYPSGSSVTLTATPNPNFVFDKFVLNGYTKLDYIESSGTQFIDTLVYGKATTETDIQFSSSSNMMVMGYWTSSSMNWGKYTDNKLGFGSGTINVLATDRNVVRVDWESNASGYPTISANGLSYTRPYAPSDLSGTSYKLIQLNASGQSYPTSAKVYGCKIWQNNTLVRDYIPVKRTSDDAIGLLDLVNLKFYGNNGTGSFTYGSELGDIEITDNPYTFTISEDVDVTAYFLNLGHSVTLLVNPLGYGSVTGDGSYPEGASVTIEATPNTHKVFVNWTENGVEISTNPSYTFTMGGADVTYTANFTDAQIFTIETSTSPSTMPSVYQSATQVYEGESVTLRAREMSGYVFTGWSDGTTANPYLLIPTGNLVITANYIPVPTSTDANSFRAYIKSQIDVNGLPIAFIDVRSFTIRRDLLTSATSDFNVLNVPTDVSNGDILVLYDSKGKVLYQGIIISIEDGNIQCSQIQSFYRGLWIYDTDPQSDLETEIASLLNDFAQGKLKGSTYTDSLVATEKSGLTISTNSSTALSLPSGEGDMDMETFIYNLYKTYGMIFDINIAYESGGYTIISIPNYTPIKIGNNSEQVLNLSPVTEVAETNKLVVFASNGTYRSTFIYTSTNGIVEEPVTDVGRYGVINTKVVRTDDPITDVVASELPSVMYNHHLTFDLLMDGNLYNFDDLKLGQPIQVWNGTDYYSTIFTGYEMSCGENERPTSVHIVCGNVRLALTQKLLMGVIK